MKHLSKVVNIIPVIAKADTMTLEEKSEFKQRVRSPRPLSCSQPFLPLLWPAASPPLLQPQAPWPLSSPLPLKEAGLAVVSGDHWGREVSVASGCLLPTSRLTHQDH